MKNIDSYTHTRGESIYLDDIAVLYGTLYATCFDSPVAHGKLLSIDTTDAEKCDGVVRVLTHKDITGENQIGGIIQDEPLFADNAVHFCGMPIAWQPHSFRPIPMQWAFRKSVRRYLQTKARLE